MTDQVQQDQVEEVVAFDQEGLQLNPHVYYQQILDTHTPEKEQEIMDKLKPLIDYVDKKYEFMKTQLDKVTVINDENYQDYFFFHENNPDVAPYFNDLQEAEGVAMITQQAGKASQEFLDFIDSINLRMFKINQIFNALRIPTEEQQAEIAQHIDFEVMRAAAMVADRHFSNVLRSIITSIRNGGITQNALDEYEKTVDDAYTEIKRWMDYAAVPSVNVEKGYRNTKDIIAHLSNNVCTHGGC